MKNKGFWALLVVLCVIGGVWLAASYAHTLQWIEGNSLFLADKAYVQTVLSHPAGVAQLVTNFLYQFYVVPAGGALCFWLFVAVDAGLLALLLRQQNGTRAEWLALLLLPVATICWLPDVGFALQAFFFLLLLLLPVSLSRPWPAACATVAAACVGYVLLPLLPLFLLIVLVALCEWLGRRRRAVWVGCAVAMVVPALLPQIWSQAVAFVPLAQRPVQTLAGTWPLPLWAAPALIAAVLVAGRYAERLKPLLLAAVGVVVFGVAVGVVSANKNLKTDEHCYLLSDLADEEQWSDLKDNIDFEQIPSNPVECAYAMLSEAAMGTLWDHLFTYPINSPEAFLFRHESAPFYLNFNRQFYATLGVPDEALHMAFEQGVQTDNGLCLKSLRQMTDYALDGGDLPLARKYMHLLSYTTLHGSWLKARQSRLDALSRQGVHPYPDRTDTFVGGYPFNSEMVRLCQADSGDLRPYNYLLAGLLLEKELDKFALMLSYMPLYQSKPLPLSFAQAVAMLATQRPQLRNVCTYAPEVDEQFANFYRDMQAKADMSRYQGTFWYYFFFVEKASAPQGAE